MTTAETWTIGRLLSWTADYLKKAGSESGRLDAEVLLAHARGCQRIELYTAFSEEPSEQVRAAFRDMVRKRAEGAPVAYLVGYKEFYSMTFEVNSHVLIPRPETEHLVVEAVDRAKLLLKHQPSLTSDDPLQPMLHLADFGTGSGAIAIAILKHLPRSRMTAIDISSQALDVARRNAQRHGLESHRLEFVEGDLLDWCPQDLQFDMIVSNPPYVSPDEYQLLSKTVRDYEPQSALLSEPDGGSVIARLVQQAANHLRPKGYLIFEFSPMLESRLAELITPVNAWSAPTITKDIGGNARVVTLQRLESPLP